MKKTLLKITVALAILGIASAFLVYRFVINKPHPDYERLEPSYVILANDLYESYHTDRKKAEETYNGKMVQLNGTFGQLEKNDSLLVGVFVFNDGMFGKEGIRCTMLASQNSSFDLVAVGQEVRVKGFVSGFNDTDVILENCSIVN